MGLSSIIPDDDDLMRQRPRMADLVPKPVPPPPGSNELPVTSRVMPSLSNPAVAPAVPTMGADTHPSPEQAQPKTVGQPSGPLVPPIDPGAISRLWTKADNIHNPVLRVIGKVGAGAARSAQTIGDTFVPGLTSQIPGTDLNAAAKRAQVIGSQETQQKENQNTAQTGLTQASAAHVAGETGEIPGQEAETAANTRKADAETKRLQAPIQESLQQSYADAVQKSVKSGKNPLQDPDVQRFADAMTSIQKPTTPKEPKTIEMGDKTYQYDEKSDHWKPIGAAKKSETPEGTWTLAEDAEGKPVLFNSKTGTTQAAPVGLQKSGTTEKAKAAREKLLEPVTAAQQYADDYMQQGIFTGPGDEALQEKFFELAKPSTGFRMSQPQLDMLRNSQSWMNSAEAHIRHATTGTWFSPEQRKQLVSTMKQLGDAKLKTLNAQGGGSAASSSPQATHIYNPATGKAEPVGAQ